MSSMFLNVHQSVYKNLVPCLPYFDSTYKQTKGQSYFQTHLTVDEPC